MAISLSGRGILLDVEGTTSAVAYVYDVMFPFARKGLEAYLSANWHAPAMAPVRSHFQADTREGVLAEAIALMNGDVKSTGLKQLQGLIWEAGFKSGELRSHVFPDVPPALAAWSGAGVDLRIYSSGSIHAQKLFFAHTEAGDLLRHFSGHYDTTTGPKRETASYAAIADDWGLPPGEILFLSDVTEELDAARTAGLQTALVNRPGNADPTPADPPHTAIESFDELSLAKPSHDPTA